MDDVVFLSLYVNVAELLIVLRWCQRQLINGISWNKCTQFGPVSSFRNGHTPSPGRYIVPARPEETRDKPTSHYGCYVSPPPPRWCSVRRRVWTPGRWVCCRPSWVWLWLWAVWAAVWSWSGPPPSAGYRASTSARPPCSESVGDGYGL